MDEETLDSPYNTISKKLWCSHGGETYFIQAELNTEDGVFCLSTNKKTSFYVELDLDLADELRDFLNFALPNGGDK